MQPALAWARFPAHGDLRAEALWSALQLSDSSAWLPYVECAGEACSRLLLSRSDGEVRSASPLRGQAPSFVPYLFACRAEAWHARPPGLRWGARRRHQSRCACKKLEGVFEDLARAGVGGSPSSKAWWQPAGWFSASGRGQARPPAPALGGAESLAEGFERRGGQCRAHPHRGRSSGSGSSPVLPRQQWARPPAAS